MGISQDIPTRLSGQPASGVNHREIYKNFAQLEARMAELHNLHQTTIEILASRIEQLEAIHRD